MATSPTEADRIDENWRDNRNGVGQFLERDRARYRARHDDVGLETNQLFRKQRRSRLYAIGVAALEGPVLAFHISKLSHALQESTEDTLAAGPRAADQTSDHRPRRSLGYPRAWPQRNRSRKARYELPPPHAHIPGQGSRTKYSRSWSGLCIAAKASR